MEFEAAKYEEKISTKDFQERIKLIELIMAPYIMANTAEKCGDKFDQLYEKSLPELRIYYQVFK